MTTAVQVQYRRGTSSQVASFTGAQGEMVVDTTNNRMVIQDGATAGGFAAAKLSEVITNARTQVSDGNYTALATDRTIAYITLTASRIVSLPAAASYPTGSRLLIVDESGSCSATKTLTLAANGSDLIDGASSAVMNSAYGYLAIESNGANKWTIIDQVQVAPVSSINALTGAIAVAASDGAIVSASGATVTIGGPGGMVNKFRNGAMDVWQRGNGSITVTTAGGYTADGWSVLPTGASVGVAQAGGRLLTKNALQVTGATSVTDVIVKQRIESLVAAAFCSQTVTVQAQIYNGTGGSITPTLTIKHASAQDNWSSPVTDLSAAGLQTCPGSSWTQIAFTFSASAGSYNGLEVSFDFGNNFGANTKTVQITECDIRVTPGAATGLNSNPPPPELRPVAMELAFCRRYARSSYAPGIAPGSSLASSIIIPNLAGSAITNGNAYWMVNFDSPMRATPTVTLYSYNGNAGQVTNAATSDQGANTAAANFVSAAGFVVYNNSGSTLSIGANGFVNYFANAEL